MKKIANFIGCCIVSASFGGFMAAIIIFNL